MTELTAEQVRKEVADWVEGAWDPDLTLGEWWKRLAASGYAHPMLPEDCGGRGYPRDLSQVVSRELAAHQVVGPPGGLGVMLAAPTIAVHGDDHQKSTFIPRILDGTDAWCQLFSEPAAGSDLAGLQCKAELDGDEYVITGQKVWTSGGQVADWGMLLARTDPDATKHAGISYFAFDMHQPGVDVRPLREMTGRAMFNEVFIDEARVPVVNLIGGLNNGWAVANTTLAVERASLGSSGGAALATVMPGSVTNQFDKRAGDLLKSEDAVEAATGVGSDTLSMLRALAADRGLDTDPVVRQGLAEIYTLSQLNRWNVARARSKQRSTGVEPNLAKLLGNITLRHTRDIANHIIGAEGTLWGPDALSGGAIQEMTVFSPGPSIYGGSDQIQRNIISERGLGLPKEPGGLKGVAFKDLPKNV